MMSPRIERVFRKKKFQIPSACQGLEEKEFQGSFLKINGGSPKNRFDELVIPVDLQKLMPDEIERNARSSCL